MSGWKIYYTSIYIYAKQMLKLRFIEMEITL